MQRVHPIRTHADDADGYLELFLEEIEVGDEVCGKLDGIGDLGEVGVPAGKGNVLGGNGGEFAGVGQPGGAFAGGSAVVRWSSVTPLSMMA